MSATSGEPAVRSDFDVYIDANTLTYVKEPCASADTEAKFFLAPYPVDGNDLPGRVVEPPGPDAEPIPYPVDGNDLPGRRRQYGFDNPDFDFDERGVIFDGRCMAGIPLPEYDITCIGAGRYAARVGGGFNRL